MFLFEPPTLAAIARCLSTPDEGAWFDIVECPAQHRALVVNTTENDPVALGATLDCHDGSICRTHKDHTPRLGLTIEKSHRGTDTALLRAFLWIGDPDILQGAAVED